MRVASRLACRLGAVLLFMTALASPARADLLPRAGESASQRDARMAWWREAKFGMFIHWGLYAVPAGTYKGKQINGIGEWIMHEARIPVADYADFARQFNPVHFDAAAWADTAKAAGMKYLIITAKHHDGFAMFPSKVDGFNIHDATPFKRDPLKELSEACAKRGIKFGVYYSQAQDWHHPGGGAFGGHWDNAQDGDYDTYLLTKSIPQVRELLINYHPAVLWFDTPIAMRPERTREFIGALKLCPDLICNNRLGNGVAGDTETPEQSIPARGFPGRDWETCMTINDTWGYKSYDKDFKSVRTLLTNLVDICSKGGNYLLNVGPTAEGVIPHEEVDRIKAMGAWLAVNGDSIYGTNAGPFRKQLAWGRCTQKPGKLYLHVFNWPTDGKLHVPVRNAVSKACLLVHPDDDLSVATEQDGEVVTLPAIAPDPIDSVVVLDIADPPAPLDEAISQQSDGTIQLGAADAEIVGSTAQLEGAGSERDIGYWTDPSDFLRWSLRISRPGTFKVRLTYSLPGGGDGADIVLSAAGQKLSATLSGTGGWETYHVVDLGSLTIKQSGQTQFELKPTRKLADGVMNLRSLALTPVQN